MRPALSFLAVFLVIASAAPARAADDSSLLVLSGGVFGEIRNNFSGNNQAGEFHLRYQGKSKYWIFKPMIGAMGTTEGSFYGYAGVLVDLYFGKCKCIVFTPSFAAGGYHAGDGKDLGFPVEFRSTAELAYRFENRSRLGVSISHISNASLASTRDNSNPGAESLLLNYAVPVEWFFGR